MWKCDKYLFIFVVVFLWYIVTAEGRITNKIVKDVEKNKHARAITNKIVKEVADNKNARAWNEPECLSSGGTCIPSDECPAGSAAPLGLCASQQEYGVECCYGISTKEVRCEKRGGLCQPKFQCPEGVRIPWAKDCNSNEVCCALV